MFAKRRRESGITLQILVAVAGVVIGFITMELVLRRRGFVRKRRVTRIDVKDIPKLLKERFLADSCIVFDGGRVSVGVSEREFDSALQMLESTGSRELVAIDGSEFKYVARFSNFSIYVRGNFVSMRDFSELWSIIREVGV